MQNSIYYSNKIKEYEDIKTKLESIITQLDTFKVELKKYSYQLENLIISNDQIDEGKTAIEISKVRKSQDDISEIIAECNKKISINTELYNQALIDEKASEEK